MALPRRDDLTDGPTPDARSALLPVVSELMGLIRARLPAGQPFGLFVLAGSGNLMACTDRRAVAQACLGWCLESMAGPTVHEGREEAPAEGEPIGEGERAE